MNLLDLSVNITANDQASSKVEGISAGLIAKGTAAGNLMAKGVEVGVQALMKMGSAAVDFVKDSVNVGMNFDSAMSQVAATMGVTTDQIGNLRDFAQEMGATTAFSATEAAEALNYMALAGYDADTSMQMLPNVLNLAAAGNMELAAASDMVTDSQTALGLSLDETNTLVDQMAQTASSSNTSVAQLGDAILTVGGTAKNLSGGITEMNTVLGVMADNGIKGSEAGTHLRNVILALSAPTDKAASTLESLGVSAVDMEGNLRPIPDIMQDLNYAMADLSQAEKTQALSNIFNKTDLASVNALLYTTCDNVDEIGQALMDTGVGFEFFDGATVTAQENANAMAAYISSSLGVMQGDIDATAQKISNEFSISFEEAKTLVETTANTMGESSNRFDELAAKIEGAGISISSFGQEFGKVGGDLDAAKSKLEELGITTEDFEYMLTTSEGSAELFVEGLHEAANSGVELDDVMNAMGVSMEDLQGAFDNTKSAAEAMANTQLDNLAGDITLMNSAIEGVQIAISDILSPSLRGLVQIAGTSFQAIADSFKNGDIVSGAQEFGKMAANIGTELMNMVPQFLDIGLQFLAGLIDGFGQGLPQMIPALVQMIVGIAETLISNVHYFYDAAFQLITGLAVGLINAIPALVEMVPQLIQSLVVALVSDLSSIINGGILLFTSLIEAIPPAIIAIVEVLPQIILAIVNALLEAMPQLIEAGITLFMALVQAIPTIITTLVPMIPEIVMALGNAFIEAAPQLMDAFGQMFGELPGKAAEFFGGVMDSAGQFVSDLAASAQEAGGQFLDGIVSFFTQLPGNVANFLSNVISNVGSWVGQMASNASQAGTQFLNNVVNFITQLPGKIANFLSNIISNIATWVGNMATKATEAGTKFLNGVQTTFNNVVSFFTGIPGKILSALGNLGSLLVNAGKSIIDGLLNGLKSAIGAVWNFVGGIAGKIASLKGPEEYDRKLLIPNGGWIMQSLADGLEKGFPAVEDELQDITRDLANTDFSVGIDATASVNNVKGRANGQDGTPERNFVFNVTINATGDAAENGRKLSEVLYKEMRRMELNYL